MTLTASKLPLLVLLALVQVPVLVQELGQVPALEQVLELELVPALEQVLERVLEPGLGRVRHNQQQPNHRPVPPP